jgi:hypothetical protein
VGKPRLPLRPKAVTCSAESLIMDPYKPYRTQILPHGQGLRRVLIAEECKKHPNRSLAPKNQQGSHSIWL